MAKKNCRMTEAERAIHDRAVSIRKMTDRQICEFVDRQYSNGMGEGIKVAKQDAKATKNEAEAITKFIEYLTGKVGTGNGIGNGTIYRLKKELQAAVTDEIIRGTV